MSISKLLHACKKGDLALVKNIFEKNMSIDIESVNSHLFLDICRKSDSNVIDWVLLRFPDINIYQSNKECLKIIFKKSKDLFKKIVDNHWTPLQALFWAALSNYTNICKWLTNTYTLECSSISSIYTINLYSACIKYNSIESFLYLFKIFPKDDGIILTLMLRALQYRNIKLCNQLMAELQNKDLTQFNNWLFCEVCSSKQLLSIEWMFNTDNRVIEADLEICIINAIKSDSLEIFDWLMKKNKSKIDKFVFTRHAIINDSLTVFTELVNKYDIEVTLYTFYDMCEYGASKIVSYSLQNDKIKNLDNASLDNGFYMAGINEYPNIMKLLLEYNKEINIDVRDDLVFKKACHDNNIDMAGIFVCAYPEVYTVVIENGDITSYMIKKNIKTTGNKSVDSIDKCSICFDKNSEIVTDCNHQFCWECINNWHMLRENCPYCRNENMVCYTIEK